MQASFLGFLLLRAVKAFLSQTKLARIVDLPTFALFSRVWVRSAGYRSHSILQLFGLVLKFFLHRCQSEKERRKTYGEKEKLALVLFVIDVVVGLVGLVHLEQTLHLVHQPLRGSEQSLLGSVLGQARLVHVQLSVACLSPKLNELEEGVHVVDLADDLLGSSDPEGLERGSLNFFAGVQGF